MSDLDITEALCELHQYLSHTYDLSQMPRTKVTDFASPDLGIWLRPMRGRIAHLATSLSIDLDEAKRVWREYARGPFPPAKRTLPATILAMHALISDAREWSRDPVAYFTDDRRRQFDPPGFQPTGFPICLARLDLMAEELGV